MTIIEIDGAMGEGGGQVLRSSLTLSMVTGLSVSLSNIRAGRRRPGLLRQHLAAVRAAQGVSNADVRGDALGSASLTFNPGQIRAGDYEFRIGSAGSTTLLMQTVLPALALAGAPSTVTVYGGTHNGMAPSVDFCERTLLPVLATMGLQTASELRGHGFYPNGGGCWSVSVEPWVQRRALSLTERGAFVGRQAVAKVSNLKRHIAEREVERVAKKLGWQQSELEVQEVSSPGPGNIVSLRCRYEHIAETFEAVGTLGVSAERVAGRAIRDAKAFQKGRFAVGEYLADQLLVPMLIGAGGEFTTGALSDHSRTNMALIDQFLETSNFEVTETDGHTNIRIHDGLALTR